MKSVPSIVATASVIVTSPAWSDAVTRMDSFTQVYEVTTKTPALEVSNIWGDVRVRPGKAGQIVVSVKEDRRAANQRNFDRSLELIQLNVEADDDSVYLRVGNPEERWSQTNQCRDCRVEYQFDIEVPPDAVLDVSTVNDGAIDVSSIRGVVNAGNVNGPVYVESIQNCQEIRTVNGPVNVSFAVAPRKDCSFMTVNGDVTVTVPSDGALEVSADLFNGDIYSEFTVEPMSRATEVERVNKKGKNKFVLKKSSGFRIGTGGPLYSVKSMNGDLSIRKAQ